MKAWLHSLFSRRKVQYLPQALATLDADLEKDEVELVSIESTFQPKLKAWRRKMHQKMKALLLRAEVMLKRNPHKISSFVNIQMDEMAETLESSEMALTKSMLSVKAKDWVRKKAAKMQTRLDEWEDALERYGELIPEK